VYENINHVSYHSHRERARYALYMRQGTSVVLSLRQLPPSPPSFLPMSRSCLQTPSSSRYQVVFDNALEVYKKETRKDLASDPLLRRLEVCGSPDAVLAVLREQFPRFDKSGGGREGFTNWLNPTVNVLYRFSETIGGVVSLVSLRKFNTISTRLAL